MISSALQEEILEGIPKVLPPKKEWDKNVNHAPKRKEILTEEEKKLALSNALRYFPVDFHKELAAEFKQELDDFGRIYMHRFMPDGEIKARSISEYPGKCEQAKAIMLMIQNNLDACSCPAPTRIDYLWRERRCIPKLDSVSLDHEVFVGNDKRTNFSDVLWTSDGIVSFAQRRSKSCSDKWNDDPELFKTR